jgi:gluconokinase
MEWYLQHVLQKEHVSITELIETTADLPPGAEGLLFLPYLMGERAPIWDAGASAGFVGLTYQHTGRHLVSAMMEGSLMALYSIGQLLRQQAGESQCIWASGGFTRSDRWLQMLADVFGLPVHVTASGENSAIGACFMAMKALDLLPDYAAIPSFLPVKTICQPRPEVHLEYNKLFEIFLQLYPALQASMQQLKAFRQG